MAFPFDVKKEIGSYVLAMVFSVASASATTWLRVHDLQRDVEDAKAKIEAVQADKEQHNKELVALQVTSAKLEQAVSQLTDEVRYLRQDIRNRR